jgi:hypothetical protein
MLLEQVEADAEVVRGQDVQSAMTEVHAATDATIEAHAATDATTEVHAATDATTEVHAATDATIEAHAATDATIEAHAPTDATIEAHAPTDATIGGHAQTIVMEVILDHSVMTDHRASVIVTVMSASPLPMNHQRCVNLEEGPQHAEVVRVEAKVDAGRVREVRADVVWAAVARMGSHHHLLLLAAETQTNVVRRHMFQTATCSKRISMRTNPKRERCEAGGINHPPMVKLRNRIRCHKPILQTRDDHS